VEFCAGDITDANAVEQAVRGAKIVLHAAAKLHLPDPGPEVAEEYRRVNVEGTRNVIAACSAAGVERLVYCSTITVYGDTGGGWADEDTLPHPLGIYAETKWAGERLVLTCPGQCAGETVGVVLRFAAVYGPHMKGNYLKLVRALDRGLFFPVGDGKNRRTVVHEQDAARAALLAGRSPSLRRRIYNVSDGGVHSIREILEAICAPLGRKAPRWFFPVSPAHLTARVMDALAGLVGKRWALTAMLDKFVEDVAVRAERIQQELDFRPQMALAEGWRQTVAAWQEDGTLRAGTAKESVEKDPQTDLPRAMR
jgi:UDP-glucose 4-epimerase